ncbi:MAG: N6-L-threonylcarbamoyladenine synthase [Myxococcota bacterium]
MKILGIETSCDETAAAVVEDGRWVHSSVISSQVPVHRKYGGVVPELASRAHQEAVLPVIDIALDEAGCSLADIELVAVTKGPGLIGALMVGVQSAKAIAWSRDLPLVGVDHIQAHLAAIRLADPKLPDPPSVPYPHLALAVSGGHTALYRVEGPGISRLIGQTLDDAAGEAFDKVSKMLGLGYPGGRVIDDLAKTGNPGAIEFPRAWLGPRRNSFSFSGLKTSVRNHLKVNGIPQGQDLSDLCASFQEAVVHVLVKKTLRAAGNEEVQHVVLGGGVAANSRLRARMTEAGSGQRIEVHCVPLRYCSDNAAMIAALGYERFKSVGPDDPRTMDAESGLRTAAAQIPEPMARPSKRRTAPT